MEKLSINFLGEKIKVDFPNDLSDLYQKIMNNFFLSEKDVKELLITYTQDPGEMLIEKVEDFKLFIEAKVDIIDIDINQSSELYKNSFIKVQKESPEEMIFSPEDYIVCDFARRMRSGETFTNDYIIHLPWPDRPVLGLSEIFLP